MVNITKYKKKFDKNGYLLFKNFLSSTEKKIIFKAFFEPKGLQTLQRLIIYTTTLEIQKKYIKQLPLNTNNYGGKRGNG